MGGDGDLECWWIKCHFDSPAGHRLSGMLIRQGVSEDDGEWVVVSDRGATAAELAGADYYWVWTDDVGDMLLPASSLAFAELVEVS